MKARLGPIAALLTLACSGPGNTGRSEPSVELRQQVPWISGAPPVQDANGAPILPAEPVYPPIGQAIPDWGSGPIDCSGLADIELSPFWVENFEPTPNPPGGIGVAEGWSSYDDKTPGSFRVPADFKWYSGVRESSSAAWGLAADRAFGPSCDGLPNEWALHFRGGRFNYFGAGAVHSLAALEQCPAGSDFCPPAVPLGALYDSAGLPTQRADGMAYAQQPPHQFWDLSAYDGVTFWARTGPDGEPSMMVALQNKYTSDDLARENQTFCQRIKDCRPVCLNGEECLPDSLSVYRCMNASTDLSSITEPALLETLYPRCGASACTSPSYYADVDFDNTECKPYEFSGSEANHYCYADTPPPESAERCGDGFLAPVKLSTDWQLYKIPFTEFRQVGWGKKAPSMDLTSVATVAFQFSVGFADVYIDNLSFYRTKR